jgi:hypothetical protein
MVSRISVSIAVIVGIAAVTYYYFTFRPTIKPNGPIVTTNYGKVQGVISASRDGRKYFEYLGIPYAKAPLGELRFEVSSYNSYTSRDIIRLGITLKA